jgi:pilus assembly protein CpaB
MNPGASNRRFVMLAVTLGLIGAVLVYVLFSRDPGSSVGGTATTSPVVVAKVDIPARTLVQPSMIEVVLVPDDVRNLASYTDMTLVTGKVTRFPIAAREQVISSKIVNSGPSATSRSLSYVIPQGKRGFAINTSDVQNAGGLVIPGDYVDVIAVYDVEFTTLAGEKETEESFFVRTILQNIEVLAVQQTVNDVVAESRATPVAGSTTSLADSPANGQRARNSEANPLPGAATVTLALTPEQVQTMYLAEENGRIRLSLRPFEDGEEQPVDFVTNQELFPRNLPNPFTR